MKLGEAFIEVRPDTKAFGADLQREVGASASSIGRTLQQAIVGGAFLAGAKKAVDAASDLNEAANVTKLTFGAAEDQVSSFAKTAAESIGQSEAAARQATATFGGLLVNLGLTDDEAAKTAISLTKLSSDLASAFNSDPADAALALSSALRGEQEPIMRYNVLLSDQAVRAKAVELGLAASTAAVDEHGKVQARLALIMEQTSRVQGDFANTSGEAANAARISAAKQVDAAADLGDNLLPIYTKLTETVGMVADAFGSLPEPVQTALIVLGGIVALTGPVKAGAEAIGSLAAITRNALSKGLDTAAVGAYNLVGNLGRVATGAGVLGAAFVGASLILNRYEKDKAAALQLEKEYTDILSEQTDGVHENAVAFAGSEILKGGLGEKLREAGVDLDVLTRGITEHGKKVAELDNDYSPIYGLPHALDEAGLEGSAFAEEVVRIAEAAGLSKKEIGDLIERLANQAEGYQAGTREAKNKAEADKEAGVEAETAAPKVEELADKLDINEESAKRAADSVDKFREAVDKALRPLDFQGAIDERTKALQDLATGIDERRQAVEEAKRRIADLEAGRSDAAVSDARAIADAEERLAEARGRTADTDAERETRTKAIADAEKDLARAREDAGDGGASAREIADAQAALQEALDATSLTLDGNSEAALRNRDELRNLVDDSIDVITTARDQGRELGDLKLIRENEIQSLRDQLEQMGYNKEQIEVYIDAIEKIPLDRTTVLNVDDARAQIQLEAAIKRLNRQIELSPLSIDVAVAERFATGPRSVTGHAAGGSVFDGDFLVGEAGVPELLRKRGADLEVISGAPTALGGGGSSTALLVAIQQQNELLAQIAGNTAGPTTGQRLRRVQTTAGAI